MEIWDTVDLASLYHGNALTLLEQYEGAPFGLTVTSPPYNLGKEYDGVSDEVGYDDWCSWMEQWLRLLRENTIVRGRLCLNVPINTNKFGVRRPVARDVATIAEWAGWSYNTEVTWAEGNISGTAFGSWASPSAPNVVNPNETILVLSNGEWNRPAANATQGRTSMITGAEFKLWRIANWAIPGASAKRFHHPAPYPEALVERCLKLFSFQEDVIFDPFVGSGTTCVMASRLGQHSVGCDVSEAYLRTAEARILNERQVENGEALVDADGKTWLTLPLDAVS